MCNYVPVAIFMGKYYNLGCQSVLKWTFGGETILTQLVSHSHKV